jgi:hypothetical protein
MKTSRHFDKVALAALLTVLAGGCAHKLAPQVGSGELITIPNSSQPPLNTTPGKEVANSAGGVAQSGAGLVVHVDPITGQILAKPPIPPIGQELELQQLQSVPAQTPQVLEVPSTVPGGGVKVNLNRQFHIPLVATIETDGKIKLEHRPAQQADIKAK